MKLCIYVFRNISLNIPNYFIKKKKCLNSTIKGIKASLKRQIGFTTIIFFCNKDVCCNELDIWLKIWTSINKLSGLKMYPLNQVVYDFMIAK
jgi:hypothetical protein